MTPYVVMVTVVAVVTGPVHDATFKKTSSLRHSCTNIAASFSSSTNGLVFVYFKTRF